ncbi:MAG: thermonuclease family protein [Candidatus Omnitrophota bacterium]
MSAELNPLLKTSARYEHSKVLRVLAIDRFLLDNNERITLIGVQGPKPPGLQDVKRDKNGFIIQDTDPTTPFNLEAFRFVKSLAEGKSIRIELDTQRRDNNGDTLAYVFLPDGSLLNAEVIRWGYADLKLIPPNMKYAGKLRLAYQEARREMRGLQGQ